MNNYTYTMAIYGKYSSLGGIEWNVQLGISNKVGRQQISKACFLIKCAK